MNKRKHKTDYQLIAEKFDVTTFAVKRALERREQYPDNRLVKAWDKLQKAKKTTLKKLA